MAAASGVLYLQNFNYASRKISFKNIRQFKDIHIISEIKNDK